MQFATIFSFAAVAVASVAALPQASSSSGSCSTGTASCCSSVHSGADAKSLKTLLGLNDVAGDIGLSCQQVPINAVGAAVAVQNQCKSTPVCCTGSHANGLIQADCTPLSVN